MILDWGGWNLDVSTFGMMLTIKLVTISTYYRDGLFDEKDKEKMHKYLFEHRAKERPSILEFFHTVFQAVDV